MAWEGGGAEGREWESRAQIGEECGSFLQSNQLSGGYPHLQSYTHVYAANQFTLTLTLTLFLRMDCHFVSHQIQTVNHLLALPSSAMPSSF